LEYIALTLTGKTARQAIDDVNFKFLQEHADIDDIVSEIKSKKTVSRHEYRLLTGACSEGVETFIEQNGIDASLECLPLNKVIEITRGAYGGSRIAELFQDAA